jgi:hypothetical protein
MKLRVIFDHDDTRILMTQMAIGSAHWADVIVSLEGTRVASMTVTDKSNGKSIKVGKLLLQKGYAYAMSRITDIAAHGSAGPHNLTHRASDAILQLTVFQRIRYPFPG